ncbi:MAG: XRE family transcriptional regulator [Pseudonocardiales bacterium]|nr:XRE family transcriptional regulator [Pseudonocardiales bacterium]MBV9161790.1 XRE family transcriptional regulator [Pseudonocardiales bacterium]
MEKTPNDKFRKARERTQSRANSEYCLSRQELAELAGAWIWKHHGKKYDINANYIGKIEQGVIRWPNALTREAFRTVLGATKDSELGFVNARAHYYGAVVKLNDVDDVKRRKLIETTTLGVSSLVLEGPMVALLEDIEPDPIPRRVGASDIAQVRDATQEFNSWDRTYGGGVARAVVRAQVRYSAGLLEATCPERLRPELFSAVGDLAHTAAFMAVDAGAYQEARRVYRFALSCAEEVKDWPLRANVLDDMAWQETRTGRPDEGLTLVDLALVRAEDWLTATERAMLHGTRATALAKVRRVQETLRAVGTADEHFAHSSPANDPVFMTFYNAAWHAQYTGRPLFDLVIVGRDPSEATTRLTAAAAGHPEGHTRERVICLTRLASLTMVTGDPLQAASIGHEALDIAGPLRSRRAAEDLRELSRYATAHQHLEEVEHLRYRIATLLCTDNPEEGSSRNPSSIHP